MKILDLNADGKRDTWPTHLFYCPGCESYHGFNVIDGRGYPVWSYNNDPVRPTIRASLLVRYPKGDTMHICHSFITDGKIEFLTDSTHALAGRTVELPDTD